MSDNSSDTSIIEGAVDTTTDKETLGLLWEVTSMRISEEQNRQDSINDRSSKIIAYTFSVFASTCLLLSYSSDVLVGKHIESYYEYIPPSLFLMLILIFTENAWKNSVKVINLQDYKTWNPSDLACVNLKNNNSADEHSYQRFLIKAAWKLLAQNSKITDTKSKNYGKSLKALGYSIQFLVLLTLFILLKTFDSTVVKPTGLLSQGEEMTQSEKKPPVRPTPTPTPSEGIIIRKGGKLPSPTFRPTTKNINGNKRKK